MCQNFDILYSLRTMEAMSFAAITGLSARAEAIYLAVLEGGMLSQNDIANATKINRTSLTPDITELLKRGFIKKSLRGKRALYTASNPTKLFRHAQQNLQALESSLPQLVDTYRAVSKKPIITLKEGPEGLYQATLEAAEKGFQMKSFSSPVNFLSVLTRADANKIIRTIERRDIKALSLTSNTEANLDVAHTFKSPNLESRPMPPGISYPMEFLIYNQTTVITSWQHQFSVVIESADITKFVESMFDYFWALK